ncbi:hypothetical protein BUALT_Bualt03G0131600 [Buddleja alternifolia]|uniref:Uncharacterized protein n=1 Tax=Buddleja alternifolia TaxID=168488 RepID=A0AAV6XXN2_9LAMI|nr:hypothetical protein BUALT_Bualt03G0131600 [Buddleja alternifolia]
MSENWNQLCVVGEVQKMDPQLIGSGSDGAKHGCKWKQIGSGEREAAVQEEIKRMNRLPPHSSYASHRLRVLNKIQQLLSVQRTTSQDEELELLFSGLHL